MAISGPEKDRNNWVSYRITEQKAFWPEFVKKLDEETKGARFRSEILSYEELWNLYELGVSDDLSDEEESRGKKKTKADKVSEVIPIRAFSLPGEISDKGIHHTGEFAQYGYLHFDQWLYARDRARKDLYWLCKHVFDLDLQPHVHQAVCDQFVAKNFDGVFKENYSLNAFKDALRDQNRIPQIWVETAKYEKQTLRDFGHFVRDPIEAEKSANLAKTMVLLDPRGFFKSSVDAIDAIQWIINCPDIRILIVSGVKKLGEQFLKMIKIGPKNQRRSFYLPKGVRPSPFQLLFPEFVVRGVDGTSSEPMYISESSKAPQNHFSGDPTVGVISVGSSLSGFHCDVLKFDDIVTDDNCLTPDTREAIQLKADGAVNMLMPWGWHDIIGTRYFPDDYYGTTKKSHEDNPEMFNLKYFARACWKVKDEFKDVENRSLYDLTQDMVELTFPELAGTPKASWLDLRKKLKNERSFRCQQLNQPVWGDEQTISFDRVLLEANRNKTIAEVMAAPGYIYGAIDLARENKQFSDFTALAVGKVYQEGTRALSPEEVADSFMAPPANGKWILVILDVQFGKWSQTEIITRIGAMNDRWRIGGQSISWYGEDTGGLLVFKEKIVDVSKTTYGHWPQILWKPPDNSDNAKRNRIKGVETLLRTNRMSFLTGPWNTEIFDQLEKYKGQKSTRYFKDDVPDVISQLTLHIPSLVSLSKKELQEQASEKEVLYRDFVRREMRRMIFGDDSGGFGTKQPRQLNYYNAPEPSQGPMDDLKKKFLGR